MSIGLGEAIYAALKPILKIYVIIFVGYLIARYNIVTVETSRGISNMVVNAILPCLTFNKIVGNISDKDIKEVGVIVLTAMMIFVTGGLAAYLTKWATNAPKSWYWGLLFAGIFPNISDLPIAYVQSMSNGSIFTSDQVDRGVAYCCIFLATQSFLMMNFGMFRLVGLDFRQKKQDEEDHPESVQSFSPPEKKHEISSSQNDNLYHSEQEIKLSNAGAPHGEDQNSLQSSLSESNVDDDNNQQGPVPFRQNSVKSFMMNEDFTSQHSINSQDSFTGSSSLQHIHTLPSISNSLARSNSLKSNRRRSSSTNTRRFRHRANSQNVDDVINEYSAVSRIRTGEIDLSRPLSLTQEVGTGNASMGGDQDEEDEEEDQELEEVNMGKVSRVSTRRSVSQKKSKFSQFIQKYKLGWFLYILINFVRPASLGALLGIICCMIPWVKALFVHTDVHMHQAPDGQPVLSFLMDFTSYIGNACVPLGLLLLGGTLARLKIKVLPKGFWKTTVMMTVFRLMVLPIIGVAWANKIYELNWLENEVAKFITILTWSMPSATAQIYFTAFYTPLEGDHLQMDCLSVFFLAQYLVLFITLSFVMSYTLKVDLKV